MGLWKFLRGTTENTFGLGDGVNSTKAIEANVPGANKPQLRFNHTAGVWEFSHNGTDFFTIGKPASDTAFGSGWDTVADVPPSKNALYDQINYMLGMDPEHMFDVSMVADGNWIGFVQSGTAGAALAFGELCYLAAADSRWEKADADAEATAGPVTLGICVLAAAGDASVTVMLLWGRVRADAKFPTLTVSAPVYVGVTAGEVQVAAPSGTTDIIRIVGHAEDANTLSFHPSNDWMEVT